MSAPVADAGGAGGRGGAGGIGTGRIDTGGIGTGGTGTGGAGGAGGFAASATVGQGGAAGASAPAVGLAGVGSPGMGGATALVGVGGAAGAGGMAPSSSAASGELAAPTGTPESTTGGAVPGAAGGPGGPTAPNGAEAPAQPEGASPLERGADRETGIRGRIGERKTGTPLESAPVLAKGDDGKTRSALTDATGAFELFVPPGMYTLRSYAPLHHGARVRNVHVARGKLTHLDLVLDPIDVAEEVVVQEIEIPYRADTTTAAAQDQLRKESRAIGEGMGAQQMSQQGAGDAGSAAKRVVGVTIDGNQLVVRGLGGRYVRVSLNGLPIPNTDPDVPSVDLDLFPTNIIDSLNIQKVFLPDIPGEFAGGVLDLQTVSFPRKFLLSAGLSSSYNTQTTFKDRYTYKGGSYDWLGFDDGTRGLPSVVDGKKLRRSLNGPFTTADQITEAGGAFQNIWNLRRTNSLPQLGMNFAIGNSFSFAKQKRFGYLATVVYDYQAERQTGVSRPHPGIQDNDAIEKSHYDLENGAVSVQLTAIGTASVDLGLDHSITALTMYNRSMDDQARYRYGINAEVSNSVPYEQWQLRFLARTVLVNQLLGDHRNLGGTRLRLRWGAFYDIGERDEPDQRTVAYGESGNLSHRWKPTANRLWSNLLQKDTGGNAQLRIPLWPEGWLTVGARGLASKRTFGNRRFQMTEGAGMFDPTAFTQDPETLFGKDGLGSLSSIIEATSPVDSYDSTQTTLAGFALLETPIVGPLSAAGGVRVERFFQEVTSKSPFPEDNTPERLAMNHKERTDTNVLPGAAFKFAISDSMLLRSAYGLTLSRPQVRELAPYAYYDFLRDRLITGNPDLKTAKIHNVDLRWEWFFGEGQLVSVSGFYKKFQDPIELNIIQPTTQDSQYQNAKGANALGAEFELRSDLARLSSALRWFDIGGNLSLIRSRIQLADSGAARAVRRLAGQAPYVINLSLRFVHPETRVQAGLIYNVVGPRITDVGTRVNDGILPDVEEQAFHSLDFVSSWGITSHLKVKLKARNLLLRNKVLKQGSLVALELHPGLTVAMGLSYDY